jgi:hypothetical protein
MLAKFRSHVQGQFVGYIALFAALATGGAYAASQIGKVVPRAAHVDTVKQFRYAADSGAPVKTVYQNKYFRMTAHCDGTGGPNATLRPKVDNGAFTQATTASGNNNALYDQDDDFDRSEPRLIQFNSLPEETGVITYVSPGAKHVTTITYLANFAFAGRDCIFAGTAVSP